MSTTGDMLDSHPQASAVVDRDRWVACVEACFRCAQACTACADACLGEDAVADLVTCIRKDLDCADVCLATGKVLSRPAGDDVALVRAVLTACAAACRVCGDECAGHATAHGHCRVCAEACRACEQACTELLEVLRA